MARDPIWREMIFLKNHRDQFPNATKAMQIGIERPVQPIH
jgi:hypothetical protein